MDVKARVAVVAITAEGGGLARRIADALGDAEVHGLRERAGDADVRFTDTTRHVRELFEAGRPIVGVCAAGILVRSVAPALADKRAEPPVVAVSDDGAFAVPLLGGHRGGVELARRIAAAIGATAAVTTAGDRRFGVALDEPPAGWTLANPEDGKPFVAALLRGARVRAPADLTSDAPWLAASGLPFDDAGELAIRVDDAKSGDGGAPDTLVYRPRRLAVGIGCERGAAPDEIATLARSCLDAAGLAPEAVAGVFSIDLKSDEPAVHALAESLGVPARFLPPLPWKRRRRGSGTPRTSCFARSAATGWRRARLSRRRGRRASSSSKRPSRCVEPAQSPAPRPRSMHPRSARPAASWRWSGSAPATPTP